MKLPAFESLDGKKDEMAENFAVENRGYDFFKDNIPFAIDMGNCYKSGFNAGVIERDLQWQSKVSGLISKMESISKNSCCDTCQQAKLVALSALAEFYNSTQASESQKEED